MAAPGPRKGAIKTLLLTDEEIDALVIAVAKSVLGDVYTTVDQDEIPKDATEASTIVWAHHDVAGRLLCSLATALAEARY